jgi:hypothetical protein
MKRILILLPLMILILSSALLAQESRDSDPRYIIDPETGKLSMSIRVWGEVVKPGVTLVPSDADLISLLSYVGGPTSIAKLEKVRIIRYRDIDGENKVVYANIDDFLEDGDESRIPTIYPNDTIVVSSNFWGTFRGAVLPYISFALQVAQLYYWVTRP